MNPLLKTFALLGALLLPSPVLAGRILYYDSVSGGSALERIGSLTDPTFVASSDAETSLGGNTAFVQEHASGSFTVTEGDGRDMQFRFGAPDQALDTGDVPLATSAESAGNWIGGSFTAAQDLAIDAFSFKMFVNNQSGNYAARDAGLFLRIGTSTTFTQFGSAYDGTSNGDQGIISFSGAFSVQAGQKVEFRLAFTDRTNTTGGAQTLATRLGSIDISATVDSIPEIVADSIAPGAGPVSHPISGSFTRLFGVNSSNPYFSRGQSFTAAETGDTNSKWSVSGVHLQSKADQSFGPGDEMRVWIFEWLPTANANDAINWTTNDGLVESDGLTDGDPLDGTSMGAILVDGLRYSMPSSVANNDYLHFELANPIELNENAAYGVFFEFVDADDGTVGTTSVRIGIGAGSSTYAGGTELRTTDTNNETANEDLTLFVTGTSLAGPADKNLVLASPFQDGMVLQRDKPIKVWGRAIPSDPVSVEIDGTSASSTVGDDGRWEVELPALTGGGPHSLEVTSGIESVALTDVLIGDVWYVFGQSNMVRPLSEMDGRSTYTSAITGGNLPIRCLKIAQAAATSPQEEGAMTWLDNSNPGSWTSVGAVFAYRMYLATNVPTAIVWAAWGSTSIEGWMPLEMTEQFPHFASIMEDYYANDEDTVIGMLDGTVAYNDVFIRTRPNIVYNQMVHPVLDFGISGFVWYQGEANASNIKDSAQYGFTLPAFVKEYRERFGQGDLPFLGVQLPSNNRTDWPWFRESQDRLETLPNAYKAVTIDTGSPSNIHPTDKEPIGIRLSLLARKHVYNEAIEANGPTFESVAINGNQATVTLTHAAGLTTNDGVSPQEFQVAGTNQVFRDATSAVINGNTVTISSSSVSSPVAVRYAWSPAPVDSLNLVNSDGLPAAPFRTDSFPLPGLSALAPSGVADSYSTPMNQPLIVAASGILENDIDLNRDVLSATVLSQVGSGALDLQSDGSFTYTPDTGFGGADSFTYRASDGGLNSSNVTVSITVEGESTAYYLWQSTIPWNSADDDSETGDPDSDGIGNLLEFAFGLDPLAATTTGLPTATFRGDEIIYDFSNTREGVIYDVLISEDLNSWSEPPFASLSSESTTPVAIPATSVEGDRMFIRLRVSAD